MIPLRVDERPQKCVMCSREIVLKTATTANPGAPEMLEVPIGAWIGFVQASRQSRDADSCREDAGGIVLEGDHAPEMIVCCSERCLRALLSH